MKLVKPGMYIVRWNHEAHEDRRGKLELLSYESGYWNAWGLGSQGNQYQEVNMDAPSGFHLIVGPFTAEEIVRCFRAVHLPLSSEGYLAQDGNWCDVPSLIRHAARETEMNTLLSCHLSGLADALTWRDARKMH